MSSNNVEQIKNRLNIVDVVGSYVKLEKAGGNFRARCPFHNERTPSFFVSPVRDTFHCFGCNKGGDIFTFTEEMEGVDFKGALKVLAERAGVELKYSDPKEKSEKDRLHQLLEATTFFFQSNLIANKDALAYLYKRGVKPETLKEFRIGFALDDWHALRNYLSEKGFTEAEMEKAGVVISSARGYHDRFRSRIMFPISDSAGRIAAFTGRIFGKQDDATGKYINSPETSLYNKSSILYGYDKAKTEIRKSNSAILVEGQMDLIMAHQSGSKNTVAASGTALTAQHVKLIHRLADTLVLALDGDSAGLAAADRGAHIALSDGMDVRAVVMPDGSDPADVILKGGDVWERQIKEAKHIINFYLEILKGQDPDPRTFRLSVGKKVLPLVKRMSNKIDQSHFVDEISVVLGIPTEAVREELEKAEIDNVITKDTTKDKENAPVHVELERKDVIKEQILSVLLWQKEQNKKEVDIDGSEKRLRDILKTDDLYGTISDDEKRERIFEVELYFGEDKSVSDELEDLFRNLEAEMLKSEFQNAMNELKEAELSADNDKATELLKLCQDIGKKIDDNKSGAT